MKVVVDSVKHFVDEVVRAPGIYQRAVRMFVDRTPLQPEAISFRIVVELTALVEEADNTEYLLQCVMPCGIDYVNGPHDAQEEVERIGIELTDSLPTSISVRPGRLEA